ncbi:MAG: hypothetical protein WCE54_15395 [Ignavibacteriaceae bacterium]
MKSSKNLFNNFLFVIILIFSFVSCNQDVKKEDNTRSTSPKEQVSRNVSSNTQTSYNNYLTASDIEKITGIKAVKLIPKNPKIGAGGDLNFSTNDDKLIVMVQLVNQNNYPSYKKYFFKADINGLGDQAMKGATIQNRAENLVAFTKGNRCVALTVFANTEHITQNMLTIEQTTELANVIASRM